MSGLSATYLEIVSGRRRGISSDLIRAALSILSVPYVCIVLVRNAYFRLLKRGSARVERPVISVGNITVGGTGKTPMTVLIANRLADDGKRVAILLRGYKGSTPRLEEQSPEMASQLERACGDEALVLKRRCPAARVYVSLDRAAAARRAIYEGADVLVLDDGFQHRRLARNLDVVLIDATEPFGYGHFLPRGLMREPVSSLRRASMLILTRSDEIENSTRSLLLATLRRVSGGRPIIEASHRAVGLMDVKGRPLEVEDPAAMQAVIFAGIVNFDSFRRSVERMGVRVVAAYRYPDHHAYSQREIEGLQDVAGDLEANVVLTTEKDAVKLEGRWDEGACRLMVLRLSIELQGTGDTMLAQAIEEVMGDRP